MREATVTDLHLGEPTPARAMRLARDTVEVARSLVPQVELGHNDIQLELFYVAGYEQAMRDMAVGCNNDDTKAATAAGGRG